MQANSTQLLENRFMYKNLLLVTILNTSSFSFFSSPQMNRFLLGLLHNPVGLSVCGLFMVTKESALTVSTDYTRSRLQRVRLERATGVLCSKALIPCNYPPPIPHDLFTGFSPLYRDFFRRTRRYPAKGTKTHNIALSSKGGLTNMGGGFKMLHRLQRADGR